MKINTLTPLPILNGKVHLGRYDTRVPGCDHAPSANVVSKIRFVKANPKDLCKKCVKKMKPQRPLEETADAIAMNNLDYAERWVHRTEDVDMEQHEKENHVANLQILWDHGWNMNDFKTQVLKVVAEYDAVGLELIV